MNELIFTGFTLSQLLERIGQLVDSKLEVLSQNFTSKEQSEFISRHEVAELLKISLPTLNEWTKLGWLKSYKIGARVLYKKQEVINCIDQLSTYKFKKGGKYAA